MAAYIENGIEFTPKISQYLGDVSSSELSIVYSFKFATNYFKLLSLRVIDVDETRASSWFEIILREVANFISRPIIKLYHLAHVQINGVFLKSSITNESMKITRAFPLTVNPVHARFLITAK